MGVSVIYTRKMTHRGRVKPRAIALHYTGGYRGEGELDHAIRTWAADDKWTSSTDFVIARNPLTDPTCQLRREGTEEFAWYSWHSGGSVWRGAPRGVDKAKTNQCMIGVDLDNYGFLQKCGGEWCFRRKEGEGPGIVAPTAKDHKRLPTDRPFTGPVYVDEQGCGWEAYTEEAYEELLRVLAYIDAWAGEQLPLVRHEDMRSTKSDPGRAFDAMFEAAKLRAPLRPAKKAKKAEPASEPSC